MYPDKIIRHKGIEMGVLSDAPFIGARICAIDCHYNCPGCFNQHLRTEKYITETAMTMIARIVNHGLAEGIILGGLEWTEQSEEMLGLIKVAQYFKLKVMIYTHHTLNQFLDMFPDLQGQDIYLKCGEYRKDVKGYVDKENDVILASDNQRIYNLKNI